jgi:hypothetical protein
MSQSRTRFFLVGSAAVVAAGLAVGTVAYMGGLPRALASQAGPDELGLIPSGAAVVAYANVRNVMASEFRHKLTSTVDTKGEGREKFYEQTGIDCERDIDTVVAAVLPEAMGGTEFGLLALRGRFDTVKIEGLVAAKGGVMDEYRGARLLLPPADVDGQQDHQGRRHPHPVIALVDANLVMVGTIDAVQAAIDRHHGEGSNSILADGDFVRMLDTLESDSTAWAIGRASVLMAGQGLPAEMTVPGMAGDLSALQWVAASGHVNGGLRATLQAEASTADAGQNLRELVQGVVALARLQAEGRPELKTFLQTLQVEGSGTGVAVRIALPADTLDLLVGQMARQASRDHLRRSVPAE